MKAEKRIDFSRWGRDHVRPSGEASACLVDIWAEDEDETDCLFVYNGAGLMARNNLHLVRGREKTGKSAFGVILITTGLGGEFLGVRACVENMRATWIDTEQDLGTLKKKARKAVEMAQDGGKGKRVSVYSLKGLSPAERLKTALEAIRESPADFVFLDGLADLCADFNDPKECARVVDELVNVAEETRCALLTVIHTSKTDKSEARGHIGAIAQQKAGEVYEVRREPGGRVADVGQVLSRFASVPDLSFEFGDDFALLPAYGGLTKQQEEERVRLKEMQATFGELLAGDKGMSYSELADAYGQLKGCSKSAAQKAIRQARRAGVLLVSQLGHTRVHRLAAAVAFEGMNEGEEEDKI